MDNIHAFHIIFDVYDELKFLFICYFHIHFYLTAISEGGEMYEIRKKWCRKLQYLTIIQLK